MIDFVESYLEASSKRERRRFLAALARRANGEAQGPVLVLHGPRCSTTTEAKRRWLREWLSVWMARYGA